MKIIIGQRYRFIPIWENSPTNESDGKYQREFSKRNHNVEVKVTEKFRGSRFVIKRIDGKEFHPDLGKEAGVMASELHPIPSKKKEFVI